VAYPSQLESARPILIAALREGLTRTLACKMARISLRTLEKWMARAAAGEPEYVRLAEELAEAEASLAQELVGHIRKAGKDGDWRASGMLLERLHPREYGPPRQDVAVTVTAKPPRERLIELIARAKERRVSGAEPLLLEQREPTDETPREDE